MKEQQPTPLLRRLWWLGGISGAAFVALAIVVATGVTRSFDQSVLLAVNGYASDWLNSLFLFITHFGGVYVIASVVIALSIYLLITKRYSKVVFVVLGVGGAALINTILKTIFERARPDLWQQLVSEQSFSFPSGHSVASMALALTLVGLLWYSKRRLAATIVGVVYVLAIGISRMYLGVHYPTDVLGGWLLAVAWVSFVAIGLQVLYRKKRQERS